MSPRISLLCPCCGPYHVARFAALARRLPDACQVIEVSRRELEYAWASDTSALPLETLFDAPYERVAWRSIVGRVTACLEQFGPDAVFINGYSTPDMRAIARWARARGIRVLTYFDSWAETKRRFALKEWVKRRLVRSHIDGAFVAGRRSADYAASLGIPRDRMVCGYNVVDNDFYARGAEDARSDGDRRAAGRSIPAPFMLFAGRFIPEKNLDVLMRGFAQYRRQAPNGWDLVLVGAEDGRHGPRELAGELGLSGVHWLPRQGPAGMARAYGLASALVLPSKSETWGLVVNEAMAAGLPVIVSDRCGCVPELVAEGENGFTFTYDDPAALADRMLRIADDATDREAMGQASRRIISGYTPETWADNALELVARVGSDRRKRDL